MVNSQIGFYDQDVDLSHIFPTSIIKAQLKAEHVMGSSGARVYTEASDLICASSAVFMHDLASAAADVATGEAKKEGLTDGSDKNNITVTLDHIQQCIRKEERFHSLSELLCVDEDREKKMKALRVTYSKVLSDEKYRKRKREGKVKARKTVKGGTSRSGALRSALTEDRNEDGLIRDQTATELEYAINEPQSDQVLDINIIEDDENYD